LLPTLLEYLTIEEESQIHQQFLGSQWRPNSQVLWSGLLREEAQNWADEHDLQTLTTVMGPLMNSKDPLCPKGRKSKQQWSKYIKGASVIFAWYVARSEKVTVLSPPPPGRFHPSGMTTYQAIEEPILKWAIAGGAVLRIEMVHPTVKGAENFTYQIWPVDQTASWVAAFGLRNLQKRRWRSAKMDPLHMAVKRAMEASEGSVVRYKAGFLT
jgi:hypothetical protein